MYVLLKLIKKLSNKKNKFLHYIYIYKSYAYAIMYKLKIKYINIQKLYTKVNFNKNKILTLMHMIIYMIIISR